MWNTQPLEVIIEARLKSDCGNEKGSEIFADYVRARRTIVEEIAPEIKGKMPSYSDHGPEHIAHVLKNAGLLLLDSTQSFSAAELYVLGVIVLFHDVGNIHGREDHYKNISDIYDYVRGTYHPKREKHIVLTAAGAHSGTARDGTKDTLKDLTDDHHLFEQPVRLQQLAAIVRFADELAEGPQRTSEYMRVTHKYDKASEIFHDYASITQVSIDRGAGRIVLKYDPQIDTSGGKIAEKVVSLGKLLKFTYDRIVKLDQERRYARFYTDFLAPFSKTELTFTFWVDHNYHDLGLAPIQVTDKVVPGDSAKSIAELDVAYKIDSVLGKLSEHLPKEQPEDPKAAQEPKTTQEPSEPQGPKEPKS